MAKSKKAKTSCGHYMVGVETPHGVPSKRYKGFTTLTAATKRARHESRQGYEAVVVETCGVRPKPVVFCVARKCVDLRKKTARKKAR